MMGLGQAAHAQDMGHDRGICGAHGIAHTRLEVVWHRCMGSGEGQEMVWDRWEMSGDRWGSMGIDGGSSMKQHDLVAIWGGLRARDLEL